MHLSRARFERAAGAVVVASIKYESMKIDAKQKCPVDPVSVAVMCGCLLAGEWIKIDRKSAESRRIYARPAAILFSVSSGLPGGQAYPVSTHSFFVSGHHYHWLHQARGANAR